MRFGPPQTPTMMYIGISVVSKNTKNSMPSSAQNTPIITPDRIRNEAMYWLTRSVMTSQPAITTTSVMNAVSSTTHTEMPSTPRW
jgi:hypothetical protein